MTKVTRTQHSESYKAKTDWLDPINRTIIQQAVKLKSDRCTLRDGRRFDLEFSDDGKFVKISCHARMVPFGTFSVATIKSPQWPSEKPPSI
jgi:hypothetical protein